MDILFTQAFSDAMKAHGTHGTNSAHGTHGAQRGQGAQGGSHEPVYGESPWDPWGQFGPWGPKVARGPRVGRGWVARPTAATDPPRGATTTETTTTETTTTTTTNIPTPPTPQAPAPRDCISRSGYANPLTLTIHKSTIQNVLNEPVRGK